MRTYWLCVALLGPLSVATADNAVRSASEYQLKAAFLLNFGRFTEWPVTALQSSPELNLCILGRDPFGGDLEKIVENQSIHDKPIRIIRLESAQKAKDCQILYVSASEEPKFRSILLVTQHDQVLTVSDSPHFVENGGMIQLNLENQRVTFNVNLKTVENAGLKISSKLLQIAKVVKVKG